MKANIFVLIPTLFLLTGCKKHYSVAVSESHVNIVNHGWGMEIYGVVSNDCLETIPNVELFYDIYDSSGHRLQYDAETAVDNLAPGSDCKFMASAYGLSAEGEDNLNYKLNRVTWNDYHANKIFNMDFREIK